MVTIEVKEWEEEDGKTWWSKGWRETTTPSERWSGAWSERWSGAWSEVVRGLVKEAAMGLVREVALGLVREVWGYVVEDKSTYQDSGSNSNESPLKSGQ